MLSDKERVRISKFLSLVLRHQPQAAGLTLDHAGWVDVAALLEGCRLAGRAITPEQLAEVVATNDKKRFEFSSDGLRIRASQGHSVEVELGYSPADPPETLYHGTAERNLSAIRVEGLRKGQRHHVHLSADERTAASVGQRYGKPVVLAVQAGRMHADGHAFFISTNGVWLTGHVPPQYLDFPRPAAQDHGS
ncbi:MAG: RNA 2'-phosphotransferase [Planctomycetaceae bacterium]|nr:RNA 2'-phosphotransferase [Planctomycetaceae bacterium]